MINVNFSKEGRTVSSYAYSNVESALECCKYKLKKKFATVCILNNDQGDWIGSVSRRGNNVEIETEKHFVVIESF